MTKRFVITGCGRSGTTYTARLLSELGCQCNHEVFFTGSRPGPGTELLARLGLRELCWQSPAVGEAAWEAAPWLPLMPDDTHVLHQLRHPLEFIRSRQKKGWVHGRFRSRHLPHFPRMNKKHFAALPLAEQADWLARFWIEWNALVEERARGKAYLRYRIEEFDRSKLNEILTWIQFPHDPDHVDQVFSELPTNVNTRGQKREDITLELLPDDTRSRLASAARYYGYHL